MKYAVLILGVIVVALVLAALIYLSIRVATLKRENNRLNRLIDGLDEPELWLPEKERQALARKRIARQEADHEDERIARIAQSLKDFNTPSTPKEGNTL